MKNICVMLCILVSIYSEISSEQRQILQPHLNIIENAIPILEKELRASKEKYQELSIKQRSTKKNLDNESSLIQQGVLKTKLLYYQRQVKSTMETISKRESDLAVYYGILIAFAKDIPQTKILFAKKQLNAIENKLQKIMQQQIVIHERQKKAQQKKSLIPNKQSSTSATLKELNARHKSLQYKKSWSNLPQRTQILSKISYHQGVLAKLAAEELVLEKIIDDCIKEQQSMLIERTELEVAINHLQ